MTEWVDRWPGSLASDEAGLDRAFEERLQDSSTLAFRIAYGVLRNREDAQEVAQEPYPIGSGAPKVNVIAPVGARDQGTGHVPGLG